MMNRIKFVLVLSLCFAPLLGSAALQNTGKTVEKIDIIGADKDVDGDEGIAVIWVDEVVGAPENCDDHPSASCKLGTKQCDTLISLALAAKLASQKVEFTYSGQCNDIFPEAIRFRMM